MKMWREEKVQKLTTQCIDGKLKSFKKWTRFLLAATITSRDPDFRSRTKINQKCEIAITFYDGLKWYGRCTVAARTQAHVIKETTNHLHNSKPFPTSTRSRSNDNFLQNQSLKCLNIQQNIFWNNQLFRSQKQLVFICVFCVFCPVKWNQIFYSFDLSKLWIFVCVSIVFVL